jgi:hypothetical protein
VVTLLVAVATRPPPDSIWDYLELRRMARTPTLSYCSPLLFLCIPVFVCFRSPNGNVNVKTQH